MHDTGGGHTTEDGLGAQNQNRTAVRAGVVKEGTRRQREIEIRSKKKETRKEGRGEKEARKEGKKERVARGRGGRRGKRQDETYGTANGWERRARKRAGEGGARARQAVKQAGRQVGK
jgi:hypothetical protein